MNKKNLIKGIFREIKKNFKIGDLFTIIFVLVAAYSLTLLALKVADGVFGEEAQKALHAESEEVESDFFIGCVVGHISLLREFGYPDEQIKNNLRVVEDVCRQLNVNYLNNRDGDSGLAKSPQ